MFLVRFALIAAIAIPVHVVDAQRDPIETAVGIAVPTGDLGTYRSAGPLLGRSALVSSSDSARFVARHSSSTSTVLMRTAPRDGSYVPSSRCNKVRVIAVPSNRIREE